MKSDDTDLPFNNVIYVIVGVFGFLAFIVTLTACGWCRSKWKKFSQRHGGIPSLTSVISTPPQSTTEFTIFPPQFGSPLTLSPVSNPDEVIFEPLPEIRSRGLLPISENIRPARFTGSYRRVSLQDWFDEQQTNFPRNQLKYFKEFGTSWFGQAVEGEAFDIVPKSEKTKVVVKILRVDASATEHMQYLQETRPFRDLTHPNLLKLLGRCLEVHPFLLIMEHCNMDLKTCLIEHRKTPEILMENALLLRMACDISAGLQHMHEHGFLHTDVAAHSCLVTPDLRVKVGDYGTSVHRYRSDFYCLGDVAFPIRWCAPESLLCTDNIIEAKDITREANIWSFGIVLWEILEFGKLPYFEIGDEHVIQRVLIDCSLRLEQPKTPCAHNDMIYKIMQLCWLPASLRPTIQKVIALLTYLYENKDVLSESTAFESRWNTLQPIPRDHNLHHNTPANVAMKFESDFMSKKEKDITRDCDSVMSSEFDRSQYGDKSPSCGSFSIGYEGDLGSDISPSLLNLRGSVEDLISSNEMSPQEDSACETSPQSLEHTAVNGFHVTQFNITEAIKDLDDILASEQLSSDGSESVVQEKVVETVPDYSEANGDTGETGATKLNGTSSKTDAVLNQKSDPSGDNSNNVHTLPNSEKET